MYAVFNRANFSYVEYSVNGTIPYVNSPEVSEQLIAMATTRSPLHYMRLIREYNDGMMRTSEDDCSRLLDDDALMRRIRERGFDFAIMDPASAISCYYVVPLLLGIPYASLSIAFLASGLYRVPRLASYPNFASVDDPPSFGERVAAFLVERMDSGLFTDNSPFVARYAADRVAPDTVEMLRRQSLWFFLEDVAVGYALPLMPNTVRVGDIMARQRDRARLPDEMEHFVAGSDSGVILAAFGSLCDHFPAVATHRLCAAFAEASRRFGVSVIWKLSADGVCRRDGVLTSKWVPQNDLLADPRVKLFVGHGGHNSIVESVYHAKPMILIPLALDQPLNAAAAEAKGFAVRLNFAQLSVDSLLESIEQVLRDPSYSDRARLASAILRDRSDTPAQRVSAAVDHVIKYGDGHLRTAAFDLSTLEFLMVDVFLVLFAAATFVVSVLIFCCCYLFRRCCRCHKQSDHEKLKSH